MRQFARLSPTEFRAALAKGLGRAILHLRRYGAAGLRQPVLDACTHNLSYDPQCESERGEWLFSIIRLTGHEDFYCSEAIRVLSRSRRFWDAWQAVSLTGAFADQGFEPARRAIYRSIHRPLFRKDAWQVIDHIIKLDGVRGLLHVAKIVGARLLQEPDNWIHSDTAWSAAEIADKQCGAKAVGMALRRETKNDRNVRAFVQAVRTERENAKSPVPTRKLGSFEEVLAAIERAEGSVPYLYSSYGRRAPQEDMTRFFDRLLLEKRKAQLLRYLWLFRWREGPQIDAKLLELATSRDKAIQSAAISVLANMRGEVVRELGLRLLRLDKRPVERGAFELFVRNYRPGDHVILESALPISDNRDVIHWAGNDLVNIANEQDLPELSKCMLWVYEQTPCSNCRRDPLKVLLRWNRAPKAMLAECVWDCSDEIRKLAKTALLGKARGKRVRGVGPKRLRPD